MDEVADGQCGVRCAKQCIDRASREEQRLGGVYESALPPLRLGHRTEAGPDVVGLASSISSAFLEDGTYRLVTVARDAPSRVARRIAAVAQARSTDSAGPASRSGPRRSALAHQAIIAATQELLAERGYGPLTIEGVAARAGVGKQTIYRWWRSKAELVLEAYLTATLERVPPPPDSGSVRRDVHALMGSHVSALAEPPAGKIVAGLVGAIQHDPALGEGFRREVVATRRQIMRDILERGRERGELRADVDLDLVVDMLHGPTFYRLLLSGAPLDRRFARQLADQVLDAIAAQPSKSGP